MKQATKNQLWGTLSVTLMVLILAFMFVPAYASGDSDSDSDSDCHGYFCEHDHDDHIGPPGEDGKDGSDGIDGMDGADGAQGIQGIRGLDGIVPTEWRTETHNWYREIRDVVAAQMAMQVYLPQDQKSRLTVAMSRVSNTTGLGIGYAYMIDNDYNSAFTIAVGQAGGETAVSGSFGFEFGGNRNSIPVFEIAPAATYSAPPEPEPEPTVTIPVYEYDGLLLAQVQQEALDDAIERGERRYAQQQHEIEYLKEQVANQDDKAAEIDALVRAEREREARKKAIRARYAAKDLRKQQEEEANETDDD